MSGNFYYIFAYVKARIRGKKVFSSQGKKETKYRYFLHFVYRLFDL